MSHPPSSLKVLILARHASSPGGIVSFMELMRRCLDESVRAETFVCGSRPNERGLVRTAIRLVRDPFALLLQVLRHRYDVVHVNSNLESKSLLRDAVFLAILRLARHCGVLVFFHGWVPAIECRIAKNRFYLWLFRWLLGGAARIVVLSETFRNGLERLGLDGHKIIVLSAMFDGEPLKPRAPAQSNAEPRRYILFLSRMIQEKGVYELLDAFARIAPRFPEVDLVMAGDGAEFGGLKRRAADLKLGNRVRFPGYVRGDEKARLLLNAEAFVLPSYSEGMPVAMLEAMAAGAVLVVSGVGGIPEVVQEPDHGIILPEVSVGAIADALTRVLSDPAYIAEVRCRNASTAFERYEAHRVTKRIEGMYRAIADAANRQRTSTMAAPKGSSR